MWVFGWITFSIVAGYVGKDRKIGFGWAFFWSLLLTPLIGLIIAFASDKKIDLEIKQAQIKSIKEEDEGFLKKKSGEKTVFEQINEAKMLLDAGTITQQEFDAIKKNIIDNN